MIPQQGLASLPQAQQGPMQGGPMQGPMPGQAPMQLMPGMMPQQGAPTPQAMVGPLTQMHMEQLVQMMLNPRPDGPPLYAVLSALAQKQKAAKTAQAMQGQQAMAQNQQLQQQPPVAAQVVQAAEQMEPQGYASGGAVAFTNGGDIAVQRILQKSPYERTPQENEILRAAGIEVAQRTLPQEGGVSALNRMLESPFLRRMFTGDTYKLSPEELAKRTDTGASTEKLFRGMGGQQYVEPPASAVTDTGDELARLRNRGILTPTPAPTGTRPAGPRPAGGQRQTQRPATNMGVGALMSPTEVTGTPAPDALSSIISGGVAGIRALQDIDRQQGVVDPRLAELREAAYKSSQDIAARRERDRQAMLEAGQKQYEDPTDLLLAMAGSAGGKTFGEALSGAARGAGAARTAKRAEFQKVKDAARQEQRAIDDLNQALADKRVADESGNVAQRRAAERRVAEAELKITDLRMAGQKEGALQADRAEQREIAREQIANQLKVAQIGAAAKEGAAGLAEQRLALQAMRADPNYAAIVKELTEAKKMAGVSSSPTLQARLRAAEKAARDLASSYGVTPGMMGMGGAGAPAPAGEATNDPLGIRK